MAVSGVVLNGAAVPYRLPDQAGAPATSVKSGGLGTPAVNGTGTVGVISGSGKLFEFGGYGSSPHT